MPELTLGRGLFTAVALVNAFGAFLADWNETHVFNPRWPPHAKFHNGQTMSFGLYLGALTLWRAWRPNSLQSADNVALTAAFGGLYWVAGLSAIFYPEVDGVDPEFGPSGFPQGRIFGSVLVVDAVAWLLESRRVAALKVKNG